jgi:hypothetical protein
VYTDPVTGVPSRELWYSYVTAFTYFYECDRGRLDGVKVKASQDIGLLPMCGALAYSELPRFYKLALGMTGTLDCLTGKQNALLQKYCFERRTFLPSTFHKTLLNAGRGDEQTETKVVRGSQREYFDALKDELQEALKGGRATLMVFADLERLHAFNKELLQFPPDFPKYPQNRNPI